MAQKIKVVPHCDAMARDCSPSDDRHILPIQHEFVKEKINVDGRVFPRFVLKEVDMSERMNQYNVSDFYLENVIEAGAVGTLKESSYGNNEDPGSFADGIPDFNIPNISDHAVPSTD